MGANLGRLQKVFFVLGLIIAFIGGTMGIIISSVIIIIQQYNPFFYVPGTTIPYPVIWEFKNLVIVFTTLIFLGAIASAWASKGEEYFMPKSTH